jgi:phosphoribosylaminoimidazole (AIR) synthetase
MQATEAARTFNLGIGMILVVSPAEAEALLAKLAGKMFRIGQLTDAAAGQPAVRLNGLEALSL